MKYKLLTSLPWIEVWSILEWIDWLPVLFWHKHKVVDEEYAQQYPEFFEPIEENKTYDDLKEWDKVYWIGKGNGAIMRWGFICNEPRSEVFLTRQDAEDEHARREFSARKDRFIPKEGEEYWYLAHHQWCLLYTSNTRYSADFLNINLGLAFRSKKEAEELLTDEVKRLFFTIR